MGVKRSPFITHFISIFYGPILSTWPGWGYIKDIMYHIPSLFKGCRMGRSDKVSLWYVALLINTRFHFFLF